MMANRYSSLRTLALLAVCLGAVSSVAQQDPGGFRGHHRPCLQRAPEPSRAEEPASALADSCRRLHRAQRPRRRRQQPDGLGRAARQFLRPDKINVVNRAIGGLSSQHVHHAGPLGGHASRHDQARRLWLLIQFGHNDGGAPEKPTRARGSLPGIGGRRALEIENPLAAPSMRRCTPSAGYLTRYIQGTCARTAQRRSCGTLVPAQGLEGRKDRPQNADTYAGWTRSRCRTWRACPRCLI